MYESYYKLSEKPFSLLPDPEFLMLGRKHSMALAMLQYGLTNQSGFSVVTGEVGCGKTTLIRHLLNVVGDDVTVGLISDTNQYQGEMLRRIMLAFGQDYSMETRTGLFDRFIEFLIQEYAVGHRTVLIIDEAQNLDVLALEEIRALSNINADKAQIIQLILVGQPELRDALRRPDLRQFAQRIAVDYHLVPLDLDETEAYVAHRLKVAGGSPALFEDGAVSLVHEFSGGVPRLINVLCDTALVYGFGAYEERVSIGTINEVIADKAKTGLFTNSAAGPRAFMNQPEQMSLCLAEHDAVAGCDSNGASGCVTGNLRPTALVQDGVYLRCNVAYAVLFGYSDVNELNGVQFMDQIAPEDRRLVRAALTEPGVGGTLSLNGLDVDCSLFPMTVEFTSVESDGQRCIMVAVRKIDVQSALSKSS